MRKVVLLLFCVVASVSVGWATTVQQLQSKLAHSDLTDAQLAKELGLDFLNERLSPAEYSMMLAELPGPLSREALLALADRAAFMPPPQNEIPHLAPPTRYEQAKVLARVDRYIISRLPTLPDFVATRSVVRYQDRLTTKDYNTNNAQIQLPLQVAQTSTADVLYSAGQESSQAATSTAGPERRPGGLSTKGAFGSILATILKDSAQSHIQWLRWENGSDGVSAVFHFSVLKKRSHYKVTYCCVPGNRLADSKGVFSERTGYHGQIAVDPRTGTIRRLMLIAELGPMLPITRANLLVEYGPVSIGGKTYYCPLKSITISRAHAALKLKGWNLTYVPNLQITMLTDTVFSNYRKFRGDLHILPNGGGPS